MMAADEFFNQHRGVWRVRQVESERYRLRPRKARQLLKKDAQCQPVKVKSQEIVFEPWHIATALRVLENKGE